MRYFTLWVFERKPAPKSALRLDGRKYWGSHVLLKETLPHLRATGFLRFGDLEEVHVYLELRRNKGSHMP